MTEQLKLVMIEVLHLLIFIITTKTVNSVFHLHNASASRPLAVLMDGQPLKHDSFPVYLGVTLDRTLSHRQHLQRQQLK